MRKSVVLGIVTSLVATQLGHCALANDYICNQESCSELIEQTYEKVVYEDEYGLKIVEVSRIDDFTSEDADSSLIPVVNGDTRVEYTSEEIRGEVIKIATFKNENSPVDNSFDYSNTHTWSNTKSVSGKAELFGTVETEVGVTFVSNYGTTITYHVTVPAGKNVNLWTAPTGKKYNFEVYEKNWLGNEKMVTSGSYSNYTSTIVTPMYF